MCVIINSMRVKCKLKSPKNGEPMDSSPTPPFKLVSMSRGNMVQQTFSHNLNYSNRSMQMGTFYFFKKIYMEGKVTPAMLYEIATMT